MTRIGRFVRRVPLVVSLLAAQWLILPQAAFANTYCANTPITYHCHAGAYFDVTSYSGSGFNGASALMRTNCMSVGDTSSQFISNVLWVFDTTPSSPTTSNWVEAGWSLGVYGDGYHSNSSPHYYRAGAWNANGIPYYEVEGPQYYMPNYITVKFYIEAFGVWRLEITGLPTVDVYGPIGAAFLRTGLESITDSGHTYGSSSQLQFEDLTNVWHASWSATHPSYVGTDSPSNAMVYNWAPGYVYQWVRDGQGTVC